MKKVYYLITFILLIGCAKEDTPVSSSDSEFFMDVIVDNQTIKFKGEFYCKYYDLPSALTITGISSDGQKMITLTVTDSIQNNTAYINIPNSTNTAQYVTNGSENYSSIYNNTTGNIKFKGIDRTKKILEGTFFFSGKNSGNNESKVVTGSFRCKGN